MTRRWIPCLLALVPVAWALLQVDLVTIRGEASRPLALDGEVLACVTHPKESVPPGSLVLARGAGGDFLGRSLSGAGAIQVRGQEIAVAGETLGVQEFALEGPLQQPLRVLVYTLGGRFFSLHRTGPLSPAPVALPAGATGRFVLALNLSAGATLDSRSQGTFPPEQASAADCVLLWSSLRPWHLGTRVLQVQLD
jgi:hypothetical protein